MEKEAHFKKPGSDRVKVLKTLDTANICVQLTLEHEQWV